MAAHTVAYKGLERMSQAVSRERMSEYEQNVAFDLLLHGEVITFVIPRSSLAHSHDLLEGFRHAFGHVVSSASQRLVSLSPGVLDEAVGPSRLPLSKELNIPRQLWQRREDSPTRLHLRPTLRALGLTALHHRHSYYANCFRIAYLVADRDLAKSVIIQW